MFSEHQIHLLHPEEARLVLQKETDIIDVYDPMLTLKGMRLIFEKQKKQ